MPLEEEAQSTSVETKLAHGWLWKKQLELCVEVKAVLPVAGVAIPHPKVPC